MLGKFKTASIFHKIFAGFSMVSNILRIILALAKYFKFKIITNV